MANVVQFRGEERWMRYGKNTVISVRVQEETKKEAERLFDEMGLSMSTAVNLFLKQVVLTGKIPLNYRQKKEGINR